MNPAVRRCLALALSAVLLVGGAAPVIAQTDQEAAEQAAREIAEARERANQAAEDFFAAETRLELLQIEQERLVLELEDLADLVEELRLAVEVVAVNRFVSSGASGIPILTDLRRPTAQLHGDVLATVVAESGATTLDDYDAARDSLNEKQDQLEDSQAAVVAQQIELKELQTEAEAEVVRLREIESQRLEIEAVAIALAAQAREEQRQLEELQRRQAEAVRGASPTSGAAATVFAAVSSDGTTAGNLGASGGEAGGRTGGGGAGTNPRAAGDGYIDAVICPVLGGSAYGNTWGAPRSGGRRHQGVDMLAPTGTPLQAVVSGFAEQKNNALGGITISLRGDNGNRYYYAHLVGYEGVSGRVEQGQVIGYVGDTGNARGTPHLHFEIRPGGGVPVNPYPSVRAAGC